MVAQSSPCSRGAAPMPATREHPLAPRLSFMAYPHPHSEPSAAWAGCSPPPFSDPTHMHTCTRLVRRNRSSLLLRHQGSNAYTDTQEVVEHILRCVPTASDTTARRALLFFHTLGFLYARELCAPPGCVNHTLQLHPQFPARVLRWSRVRVHKDIPRPPNGELGVWEPGTCQQPAQSCM